MAGAYQVLSSWSESTITYNNAPTVSSTRLSTATMYATGSNLEASPGLTSFNISNAAKDWYSGEDTNYGIALKRESSTTSTKTSVILKSYQAGEDYPYISVNYTYYVPDGVYALKGNGFYYRWLTIEDDSPWDGKKMQQTYSAESPASTFDRSCLFKISRKSGNCYIIRSMLNNNLSFGISDGEIITKTIPSDDADVSYADTFYIEWASPGFLLRPYGSSEVIRISSASVDDLTTVAKDDATLMAQWTLVQYTGTHKANVTIYYPTNMNAGVTATLTPIVWSTQINYNTPRMESVSGTDSYATLTWNDKDQYATAVLHQKGAFKLIQHIDNANQSSCCSWTFTFNIGLVVDEGIYFIKNKEFGKYIQIDDDDGPKYDTSGSIMELWDFDGGDYQKWNLIHIKDGYYKITSPQSEKALTAPSSKNSAITQTEYTDRDEQLWKIILTSEGYKISPKSNTAYYMAAGSSLLSGNGRNVEMRASQSDKKDEWILVRIGYASLVAGEGQQKSNWCWVTAARMFSKHSYSSVTYTQTDAVTYVKGSAENVAGTRADAQQAINYYISNISGASISTVVKEFAVYSEENLVRFLDDGHVVYISRGWYSDMNDSESRNGGHATLIYGYTVIDSEIWFLVRDPWPVNEGETYMISYEKLCKGNEYRPSEEADNGVWYASIVVNTSYANETIPYYFDQ